MARHSRRTFVNRLVSAASAMLAGALAIACAGKKPDAEQAAHDVTSCDDLSQVSEQDRATRRKLGYMKESPIADNQCQNCNLYLPPKAGHSCGGCMLFQGPVYPTGYCTYWAAKV